MLNIGGSVTEGNIYSQDQKTQTYQGVLPLLSLYYEQDISPDVSKKDLDEIRVIHYQVVLREIVNFILNFGDPIFFIKCHSLGDPELEPNVDSDPDYKLFYNKIESGLELMFKLASKSQDIDIEEILTGISFNHNGDTPSIIIQLCQIFNESESFSV